MSNEDAGKIQPIQPLAPEQIADLERLLKDFEGKKKYFRDMVVKVAIGTVDNSKELKYARISFTPKLNESASLLIQDYGKLVLEEIHEQPEHFINIIECIKKGVVPKIGDFEIPSKFKLIYQKDRFISSRKGMGYIAIDWPYNYYNFYNPQNLSFDNGPFLKPGLPPHPDLQEALLSFFDYSAAQGFDRIEIILPDYRARILNLRVDGRKLQVAFEGLGTKDLSVQIVTRNADGRSSYSDTILLGSSPVEYNSTNEVSQVVAYIIDESGDRIDERQVNLAYANIPEGVEIIGEAENLEEIIKRGESETVEFKETYDKDKVLRTAIAFANTRGGIILIGVTDDGEVKGFEDDKENVKNSLTNIFSKNCEPAIKWTLTKTTIREKPTHY